MTKFAPFAIGCIAVLATPAAFAKDAPPPAVYPATVGDAVDPDARVCMKIAPVTGSFLTREQCKTVQQWRALGYDVARAPKKSR